MQGQGGGDPKTKEEHKGKGGNVLHELEEENAEDVTLSGKYEVILLPFLLHLN